MCPSPTVAPVSNKMSEPEKAKKFLAERVAVANTVSLASRK
jgi:hypothetical protein